MSLFPTPSVCDLCGADIQSVVYDARDLSGTWGCFCPECFKHHTSGRLGTGYGQKYRRQPNGRFEKEAG